MSANELAISFVGPGEVTAAGVALPVVGIIVVALRFWLRGYQKVKLGLDDYTILVALVGLPRIRCLNLMLMLT